MQKQICKNCLRYNPFYTSCGDGFTRIDVGSCIKKRGGTSQYETCEDFLPNEPKLTRRYNRLIESLEKSLKSINEIAILLNQREVNKTE